MTEEKEGQPTQVQAPWTTTVRSAFQALVGLAAMFPFIVEASGVPEGAAWVVVGTAISGAVTRIMALPQVNDFLRRFIPWLAA